MKPIHKLNNGRGATLCHTCSVIITTGLTEDLYCDKCKLKQETLEEVAERYSLNELSKLGFINGVKWQQERSYSEEEVKEQLNLILAMKNSLLDTFTNDEGFITDKWFEQFKKK